MLVILVSLIACSPTCERTCKKILTCENIVAPNMNIDECTSACNAQQNVYEDWDDPNKIDAFDELKTCIVDTECDELTQGECYNEDVYIW